MKVIWNGVVARAIGEVVNPLIALAVLGFGVWLLANEMWGITIGVLSQFAATLVVVYKPVKVLINDYPKAFGNKDMKAVQDDICRALVDRW